MESATTSVSSLVSRDETDGSAPRPAARRREEPIAFPVMRLESLAIFVLFGTLYAVLGFNVVANLHVVNFDALDRLNQAFMVWYNDPPKLAAIGFALPPVGSFVLIPFAAVRELVTSGLALPLSSALLAAGALTFVNRMFAIADMVRGARLLIVLLVGINPMFAFYAMNGTGDAAYLLFAAIGLFCLLGWGRNRSARYLIGAGLAFSLAALTSYEFIAWAFLIAFIFAWSLTDSGRGRAEVQGSTLAYFAPIAYGLGLWIFFNGLVLGDPFAWISLGSNEAPVNAIASSVPGFDLADAVGNVLRIQLIFPAALVAIPLLLLNFGGSRDTVSIGLALVIILSLAYSVVSAAVEDSVNVIQLKDALPAMMAGVAGFAWLYLRSTELRPMVWGLMVVLAVLALPTAWSQMKSYPHQNLEQAFTRAISTGDDQEGTASRGGYQVGVAPEDAMAGFIKGLDLPNNQILTDNARTYGVMVLSGDPGLFFDRVAEGDEEWQKVVDAPEGKVDYMLVENSEPDLILNAYPGALDGDVPFLETVVSNDRYTLLGVIDTGDTVETVDQSGAGAAAPTDSPSADPP